MKFHLEDCSHIWYEMIQEAENSILIVTPYFDSLLADYLADCDLPYSEIILITQFDHIDASGENVYRCKLLFDLMKLGVDVRILDRVHAKVLLTDWRRAIFGSQNFTRYSTDSIEISTEIDLNEDYEDEYQEIIDKIVALIGESRVPKDYEFTIATGFQLSVNSLEEED